MPDVWRSSGARYVPPARDVASQAACWEGIEQGVFSVFSSDHCPFRYDDPQGKLAPRGRTSFGWIPNGIPGVSDYALEISGWPVLTMGRTVVRDGVLTGAKGHGDHIARNHSAFA